MDTISSATAAILTARSNFRHFTVSGDADAGALLALFGLRLKGGAGEEGAVGDVDGEVCIQGDASLTLISSVLYEDSAYRGGAIYFSSSSVSAMVKSCSFISNSANVRSERNAAWML